MFNGPVHSSCVYKSKYNIATYREKAPHLSYGGEVDLIKNTFMSEKKFRYLETIRSFEYKWLLFFPAFVILPVRVHLTACLVLCLVKIFLLIYLKLN